MSAPYGTLQAIFILSVLTWVLAYQHTDSRQLVIRKRYKCPEGYRRVANWCFHFSHDKLNWRDAQFTCKDLGGGALVVLNRRAKDRHLKRNMIGNDQKRVERWIGGIFSSSEEGWIWGSTGEKFIYQGFSRRRPNDNYTWRCVVLNPRLRYRWNTRSCIERKNYICEVPIAVEEFVAKRKFNASRDNSIRRKRPNKERKKIRKQQLLHQKRMQHHIVTNEIQ